MTRRPMRICIPAFLCAGLFFCLPTAASAQPADLSALQWRNIGPAIAGGRVAAVAGTNSDPNLYYFGAAGGGVWKTTNGGVTWEDVFTHQGTASIGAIAIAPADANTVWVGTGESKPRNDISLGNGVWRTSDAGKTWQHIAITSPSIARILIDSRKPNTVLVGALGDPYRDSPDRGVYRTTDGGRTWSQTLYVGPSSGVSDLAWDRQTNKLVFAGMWQIRRVPWTFTSGGPEDGLFRSRDGGATWHKLEGHGLPSGLMGRIGVAVAPSNPKRIYALIQSQAGSLWKSDDAGDHWQLVSRDTYINQRPFYMSRLEVDPTNQNHLFFLSEDLVESRDGGKSISNNVNAVHQDHHAMWIAADGKRIIEGNDGGAPISLDGGATWDWRYNVTIAQIYHVGYNLGNPYMVCGGMQDNDSYCGPSDSLNPLGISNHDWFDVGSNSDGSWTWPDPLDSRYVWNVGVRDVNGQLTLFDYRTRESYDVTPYVRDTTGASLVGLPYRFNWEAPVAFSKTKPNAVYFGGNVVWKSTDRGRHWKQIGPDLTLNDPSHQQVAGGPINTDVSGAEFYDTILDIEPSPLDGSVIWVGTDDGLVQVTHDEGAHWHNVSPPIPAYGRVESLEPSPYSAASAIAVIDRHFSGDNSPYIYQTFDYGAHWKSIAGDLPADEVMHVVRQDLHAFNILYAGSERGVWISFDSGDHWQRLNNNMPDVSVHDLRIQRRANDLIAATHGLGFWILDDLNPLEAFAPMPYPIVATARGFHADLIRPRTAYTYFRWWAHEYGSGAGTCCAPQDQFVGTNPPSGAIINYVLATQGTPTLVIADSRGTIVAHLTGTNHPGINRVVWDLADDPPVPWKSARSWNQGPSQGATVVPGTYNVTLRVGSFKMTQSLSVMPDPRAQWTQTQYAATRDFMHELYGWLSQIDVALNNLDAIRSKAYVRILSIRASTASLHELARERKMLREAQSVSAEFSSNPRNSEDNQWRPDKLRERLVSLIDMYSAQSQGPPLAPHYQEAARIKIVLDAAMNRYNRLLRTFSVTNP